MESVSDQGDGMSGIKAEPTEDLDQGLATDSAEAQQSEEYQLPPFTPDREDLPSASEMEIDEEGIVIPAPEPFPLLLHDATIKCLCPPGTTRLAQDIIFSGIGESGPCWTHLPCKPYAADIPAEFAAKLKALGSRASTEGDRVDVEQVHSKLLGPNPTRKQRLLVKNFKKKFHCDGPCQGDKPLQDFFNCKKCCAWQHKPCMLYGSRHDRGGPVCNQCYMSFLLHRDEIVEWQRKRMLMAVREAWEFLRNPENRHQEWRRACARRFLSRFLYHNQEVFLKWMTARKKSRQLAAAQAYWGFQLPPQDGAAQATPSGIKEEEDDDDEEWTEEERKPQRKKPQRKKRGFQSLLEQATEGLDDFQEQEEEDDADDESADSDEIVVANSKSKAKASKVKTAARSSLSRQPIRQPPIKKSAGKRKAPSQSMSPLKQEEKSPTPMTYRSRAPRKSVRQSDRIKKAPDTWYGDGEDDIKDEEEEEEEAEVRPRKAPRLGRTAAALPSNRVSCRCGTSLTAKDCFKCRDCGLYQHYGCAEDYEDGLAVLCNFCFNRPGAFEAPQSLTPQPVAPPKQTAPVPRPAPAYPPPALPAPVQPAPAQQVIQSGPQYDSALRDEAHHLCATVLWKQYCDIPMPDDTESTAANEPPPASPPQDWLAECQSRLVHLLTMAGPQQVSMYLAPVLAQWPRQNHQIMNALRELTLEQIHRGSMKGKRRDLGLLLEVMGLEEKGRIWKGA